MNRMGGTCSTDRRDRSSKQRKLHQEDAKKPSNRSICRYSVDFQVPNQAIANLYPVEDNYVINECGVRSPKSLVELCTDTICRNLPLLDGNLPKGLPQIVVDRLFRSLVAHSALNATTLNALRTCELGELPLGRCRGISDEWFIPNRSPTVMSTDGESHTPHETKHYDLQSSMEHKTNYTSRQESKLSHQSTNSFNSDSSYKLAKSSRKREDRTASDFSPSFVSHMGGDDRKPNEYLNGNCPRTISSNLNDDMTSNISLLDLRGSQRLTDRGLIQLGNLGSVEVVKLDDCHSIVGRGLLVFAHSYSLRILSLSNCRCLTDDAIINISHLRSIEALSLDGCRCITDMALENLSNLIRLEKLDLTQCDLITDEGLHHLHKLSVLEELSLGWCRLVTDRGIDILSSHPHRSDYMRVLRLARCKITDSGIVHIGKLHQLEELDLNGCVHIGSTSLASALEKLSNLRVLDVSYCPGILRISWQGKINTLRSLDLSFSSVKDTHITRFTFLPKLEELNLDSCPVGDSAISLLAENGVMPNLTKLDLADTDLTDMGMANIPKFLKLTSLSLFYCNISNNGLRHLANMATLEELNLDSRDIDDDGLVFLIKLSNLKSLDIFSGRITDIGCLHIAKIKSLENLELCGGGIGDLGCRHLATLDNMKSLNLAQNERITNRGAACLAALTKLKVLNLSCTRVTSDALCYFTNLKELQSVALFGCIEVKEQRRIEELENNLPNLRCVRLSVRSRDDGVVVDHLSDMMDEDLEYAGDIDTESANNPDNSIVDEWNHDEQEELSMNEDDLGLSDSSAVSFVHD